MLLYPVNLNIQGKLCIVIGGGSVALRKVKGLLLAGARVRVVSPEIHRKLLPLCNSGKIEWIERAYAHGDLIEASLVFAATDNGKVQAEVMAEADKSGVLINSVDDPRRSDFHLPANFRRGQMLVTVSTSGGSPALASRLRKQLEELVGEEYEALVYLLSLIRQEVVASDGDSELHSQLFHRLLDLPLVQLIKEKNWFNLQMLLLDELPAEVDGVTIMRDFIEEYGSV